MSPSRPFILRPVATSLFMAAIFLAGVIAFRVLPLSALPEVDYPTIQVQTSYPGASPEVMSQTVTAPLERQFGQMADLNRMSSISSAGFSVITLQFNLDLNLDVAEQEVQAAINASNTLLPSDLPQPPIYAKVNPADAPIMTLALTSNAMPLPQLEDLADNRLAQKISQVKGVGLVNISGGQRPAVRIQANTEALASVGLTLDDLRTTLGTVNVNQAKGSFDGPTRAYTINANDQLATASDYINQVIAYKNGGPIRLKDVAIIIDGAENTRLGAWIGTKDGKTGKLTSAQGIVLNIQRQPGANVIQTVDDIKKALPELESSLPDSVNVQVLSDRTTGIRASVEDVEFELVLAVMLVVLVIFVFLRSLQATFIASVAAPISLVGTFAVMYLLGFSLNNLTLMALTISTGFVVDDAIVMIENIARYIEEGEKPMEAALKGAGEIGFTIISLTLSLLAVLIPLLFMADVVGRLFREFAITLAVTIVISAVVSLTLVPTLSARWLKPRDVDKETPKGEHEGSKLGQKITAAFDDVMARYDRGLTWVLDHQKATLLVAVATFVLTALLYVLIPKGLFPTQDTGIVQGYTEAGPGVDRGLIESFQGELVLGLGHVGVDRQVLHRLQIELHPGHRICALADVVHHLGQRA